MAGRVIGFLVIIFLIIVFNWCDFNNLLNHGEHRYIQLYSGMLNTCFALMLIPSLIFPVRYEVGKWIILSIEVVYIAIYTWINFKIKKIKEEREKKEEDKKYFDSLNPINVLAEKMNPYWSMTDRNSGSYLYMKRMESTAWDCDFAFGLFVDGVPIFINTDKESEDRLSQNNPIVTWVIKRIQISHILLDKGYAIDDIKDLIKEAFDGLGSEGFESNTIYKVKFIIDMEPEII